MTKKLKPLIAANWKMHGSPDWIDHPAAFDAFYAQGDREHLDILICPPTTLIGLMLDSALEADLDLGGQNCHWEDTGAHTGEVSAKMLADVGAEFVILGHSERRAAGETDEEVNKKASAAGAADLIPIICVGESLSQREAGDAIAIVTEQIRASLPDLEEYVIAYEPIWAIGTGKVPSLEDIAEMHTAIRALAGQGVRILYGGSVKPANAKDILSIENVNGALIGGASLEMESLAAIAKAAPV